MLSDRGDFCPNMSRIQQGQRFFRNRLRYITTSSPLLSLSLYTHTFSARVKEGNLELFSPSHECKVPHVLGGISLTYFLPTLSGEQFFCEAEGEVWTNLGTNWPRGLRRTYTSGALLMAAVLFRLMLLWVATLLLLLRLWAVTETTPPLPL